MKVNLQIPFRRKRRFRVPTSALAGLAGGVLGATLMFALDPASGSARRSRLRSGLRSQAGNAEDADGLLETVGTSHESGVND